MRSTNKTVRRHRGQRGQALIEVLIALVILGIIGVAFLSALATASRATIIGNERTTAESLTRATLEYIKGLDYIDYSKSGHQIYNLTSISRPSGYSLNVTVQPVNPSYDETDMSTTPPTAPQQPYPDPDGDGVYVKDLGVQNVTVKVYHQDKLVLTTSSYKMNR